MFLAQSFRKKNLLIQFLIYLYLDTCFLCYKGILAFIFEHVTVQEILCNKLQNTKTHTRYFRYYPCIMNVHPYSSLKHLG